MHIEKKTLRNFFLGVAACILLVWILNETERVKTVFRFIGNIVSPFLIGAALAFVLNVPMRAFEKLLKGIKKDGLRRGLAMLLTVLAILLVLTGVFWLLIPQLIKTSESLIETIPAFGESVFQRLNQFLNNHPDLLEILSEYTDFESMNWSSLIQSALSVISTSVASLVSYLLSIVMGLYSGIFNVIFSVAFCFYSLARKEILARQGRRILYSFFPEKFCDETIRILRMTNAAFSNFISGQCLEALILGSMFAVAMTIFRMPYMPLISVVIAVTALVPIVGAFVGCFVGAFFILMVNPMQAVWFVVLFLSLQQIEEQFVYPKVVGSSVGLPGMWVLVAVSVGGDLMGVAGMLLMIPLVSVLYALAREITNKRLKERGIDPDKLRDHPPEITSKFKEKRKARKAVRIHRRTERKAARAERKQAADSEKEERLVAEQEEELILEQELEMVADEEEQVQVIELETEVQSVQEADETPELEETTEEAQ